MAVDLTGGLDPAFEYFLKDRPANPAMRDSATLWIMDGSGAIALPRVTFDAIGSDWDRPWVQLNLMLADGRTLRVWSQEPGHTAASADGKCAIRGAGPLRFQCIEPFQRWTMEFDGQAAQSTTAAQLAGKEGGELVALSFRFEAEMAAPPWLMGGMTAEAARKMKAGDAGALMGGLRYEQLCRVIGTVRIADEEHSIAGTGMRVRRQGVRNMGAATGHCQHSALFPSGRAFGAIAFAPGPDGAQPFNEGFVLAQGGRKLAARVVEAPWMKRLVASGDDASLVLETDHGTARIAGEVLMSMFDHNLFEMADTSILHQGVARYVWDGEETIGLIERCTLRSQLEGITA
jgi:hypothetical protein